MKDTGRPFTLSWIAALIGFGLELAAVFLGNAANSTTMVCGYLATGMVMVMAFLAMGRTRLEKRRQIEAEQLEEYRRTHGATELFDDADEAVRLAARASVQYVKYFVPVTTVIVGALLIMRTLMRWYAWNRLMIFPLADRPLAMGAISMALFIGAIIASSYFVGVSREHGCRWLRPAGSWMFLAGLIFLANAGVMACEYFKKWPDVIDLRVARVGIIILLVLGVELLLSVVIEFYRPRIPGEQERPIPESRLLALFTEPGGVARNIAASLDYQFGFQVSEARFYRFLERTIIPAVILLLLLLWAQTCLVVIKEDENGLRECFGQVAQEPLVAGVYLKWPTPFERIHRFPVYQVQKIGLGYTDDEDPDTPTNAHRVIIWSLQHRKEETKYIVASKLAKGSDSTSASEAKAPVSVYSLSADVPLYFRVKNLYQYMYGYQTGFDEQKKLPTYDASRALRDIASRELVAYLSAVDFFSILTGGREEGAEFLKERIQQEADRQGLGIEVVFVGLQGIHPPVEVGAKYDQVAASSEEREEIILKADSYSIQKVLGAQGEQARIVSEAESYRAQQMSEPIAIANRFTKQLLGYRNCPQVFILYSLLDVMENEGNQARKFVVAANSSRQVYILDLLDKLTSGLADFPVNGTADQNGENKNN